MANQGAAGTPRWRGRLLVVDEAPDGRASAYLTLADQAQHFEIETSLVQAFQRMLATEPPYTLVMVPLTAAGRVGPPETFVGEAVEDWARQHAPGYLDRFIYYGSADLVRRAPRAAFPVHFPALPSEVDIRRVEEAIDGALERLRVRLRERRKAERAARRRPDHEVPDGGADAGGDDL